MITVNPEIVRLTLVDQSGNLKPVEVIEIDPSPLGESDSLVIEVKVTIKPSPTADVLMMVKIYTKDLFSFDDGTFDKLETYRNVRNNAVLNFGFVIKNLVELQGAGIGLEVSTKSNDPSSFYLTTSKRFDVKYK
jgi:hypothetical protein